MSGLVSQILIGEIERKRDIESEIEKDVGVQRQTEGPTRDQ